MAKKNKTVYENLRCYNIWFDRLSNIIINSFKWSGMEETDEDNLTSRIIERTLFNYGYGIFTTWEGKMIFLPAAVSGDLNIYFEPTKYQVFGNDVVIPNVNLENNSVLCRNAISKLPTLSIVEYYAEKFTDIQRAQDVNLFQSKLQLMVETSPDTVLSFKNAISEVDANNLVVYGNKDLINGIRSIDPKINYNIDKYTQYKKEVLNEFLQTFGFKNIGVAKNERLTSEEASSSDQITYDGYAGAMLEMRKEACKRIKYIFGKDYNVELRRNVSLDMALKEVLIENTGKENKGGNENVL